MGDTLGEWAVFTRRTLTTLVGGLSGGFLITLVIHMLVGLIAQSEYVDGQYGFFLVFLYLIGDLIGINVSFYVWPPPMHEPVRMKSLGNATGIIVGGVMSLIMPILILDFVCYLCFPCE